MTREQVAADVFRRAGASIEVGSVPVEDVVAQARWRQGRRRRMTVVGVAAAVLVVGGATWLTARSPSGPDQLDRLAVKRVPNPVDVAWYAGGRLHLDVVTVALPQVTDIVELNGGAVYADAEGMVAFVAADGEHRRLGTKDPDRAIVGSSGDGWVAWIEPGNRRLVVYNVSTDEVVATTDLASDDVRLIAIDQHRVFFDQAGASYAWAPGPGDPERLDRGGLVDVESATRVYQEGRRIDMVQSLFSVDFVRPGIGGTLSPGGTFVLTRTTDSGTAPVDVPYRPLIYDARSGDRLVSGVRADELVVDAAFGDNNTITYLVVQAADLAGGSNIDDDVHPLLVLRTCTIGGACNDVAPVPANTDVPLLAN